MGKDPYTKMFITALFIVEKYESNLNDQPGRTSQTYISKNISLYTQNEMPCNFKNDKVHLILGIQGDIFTDICLTSSPWLVI